MANAEKSDREIFDAVMAIEDSAQRADVLRRECADNPDQLARVQALLEALDEADGFMETRDHAPGTTRNPIATPIIGIEERPGSVIGNYKLLQEIGAGGFGVVYMAEQLRPVKRKVALKIIKPGMDTREVVARFEAERQALALMSHPNIAQVFDGGATDSGRPYFVMELVKGIPITEFCDKSKLSTKRRLSLFLDICSAIQHAHQKGVIHRDIKPSNVLITLHDGVPVPKVIDFGIAKALNQELTDKSLFTAYGQMIGTPQYTSPEQAEMSGLDIDTRSDIYSLGILLYELLTGETPISRQEVKKAGLQEVQRLIKEKEATKPSLALSIMCRESTTVADYRREDASRLVDQIEGDLDWIVLKALEKDRTRRYETATGLAEDIRRFLDDRPVTASPPNVTYVMGKFMRRHRRPIAAVGAIFVALLAGAIGMTVLYLGARADRATAEKKTRIANRMKVQAEQARASEARQKELVLQTARQLQTALSRTDFATGGGLLAAGETRKGLSYLARSLRTDPGFQPAAQRIVATLRDQSFDLQPETKLEHAGAIRDYQLSGDQQHLLTFGFDRTVRLWDAGELDLKQEWSEVDSAAFVGDGSHVMIGAGGRSVQIWHAADAVPFGPPIVPGRPIRQAVAAVNPAGRPVVATALVGSGVRVWNGQTGEPVSPLVTMENLDATRCFLNGDGTRLLVKFGNTTFKYLNTETGAPLLDDFVTGVTSSLILQMERETLVGVNTPRNGFTTVHFATGAKQVARISGARKLAFAAAPQTSADGSLLILRCRPTIKAPGVGRRIVPNSDVVTMVYSPTNDLLVASSTETNSAHLPVVHADSGISVVPTSDFKMKIRDLKTMRILAEAGLKQRIAPNTTANPNIVFSPSGDRIAIRFAEAGFAVYRTLTGKRQSEGGPDDRPCRSIQFSPEGQRIATITEDGRLQLWDAASGAPITAPFQHRVNVVKVAFSGDGNRVFSLDGSESDASTRYGVVRCWDARATFARYPAEPLPEFARPPVVLSDDQRAVVATRDGRILIRTSEDQPVSMRSVAGKVLRLGDLSPAGGILAASARKDIFIWNLNEKAPTPQAQLSLNSPVIAVKLSASGEHLLTRNSRQFVRVWNTADGQPIARPQRVSGEILDMAVHSGAQKYAAVTRTGGRVWSFDESGTNRWKLPLAGGPNASVEFSRDGRWLLNVSLGEARIWNVATGELVVSRPHSFQLTSARFSHDGDRIVTSGPDSASPVPGVVLVWDRKTNRQLAELVHPAAVLEAKFDPADQYVITKDIQGAVRIWDLKTAQPLGPAFRHHAPGSKVAFTTSPDSRNLLSVVDGRLRSWPMPISDPKIPDWIAPLAEAVAGHRLDDRSELEAVASPEFTELMARLGKLEADDNGFNRFGRWFAAARPTRSLAPGSSQTKDELVEQLLAIDQGPELRKVLQLRPRNAAAAIRLSALVTAETPFRSEPWRSFPEWYAGRAVRLAPQSADTWLGLADVLEKRGKHAAGLKALQEYEARAPATLWSDYLKALATWEIGQRDSAFEQFRPHLEALQNTPVGELPDQFDLKFLAARIKSVDLRSGSELADLAIQLTKIGSRRLSRAPADWFGRWAMQRAPNDPAVIGASAKVARHLNLESPATRLIAELLQADPANYQAWFSMAGIKLDEGDPEAALPAIEKSLELHPEKKSTARRRLKLQILSALGRADEMRRLHLQLEIRDYFQRVPEETIDLKPYYNRMLTEPWRHGMNYGGQQLVFSDWGKRRNPNAGDLDPKLYRFDGLRFDIRGAILLDGQGQAAVPISRQRNLTPSRSLPNRLTGIRIDRKAKSLHFIHGVHNMTLSIVPKRLVVGSYRIHFANGESREFPIETGRDVWPLLHTPGTPWETENSTLAWTGRIPAKGPMWRTYHSEWKNPLPDVEITHIDFTAVNRPVLFAITSQ